MLKKRLRDIVYLLGMVATASVHASDLCSVVTPADVESIIKDKVVAAQPLKYTNGCRYATTKPGGGVTLNFLNTGGDAKEEFAGQKRLQALSGKTQDIGGLGDEAVFNIVLIVRKGDRVLMVEPQALAETQRREQAMSLARLVLKKQN